MCMLVKKTKWEAFYPLKLSLQGWYITLRDLIRQTFNQKYFGFPMWTHFISFLSLRRKAKETCHWLRRGDKNKSEIFFSNEFLEFMVDCRAREVHFDITIWILFLHIVNSRLIVEKKTVRHFQTFPKLTLNMKQI